MSACASIAAREKELRELRSMNTQFEEQNAILSKHVDQLKTVITGLEEEAKIQRNNNIALVQHLETLRENLATNFVSIPLPGNGAYCLYIATPYQYIVSTPSNTMLMLIPQRLIL